MTRLLPTWWGLRRRNGFTLVELMVAVVILVLCMTVLQELFRLARQQFIWAASNEGAMNIAAEKLTEAEWLGYHSLQLTPGTPEFDQYTATQNVLVYAVSQVDANQYAASNGSQRVFGVAGVLTVTVTDHPYGFRYVRCQVDWDTNYRYQPGTTNRIYANHAVVEGYVFP
jgi:prepilin-type N-terminal cleavage/methylation domain-containing protein